MKFVKGISLFFIYPVIMLGIGIFVGVWGVQFFYPGMVQQKYEEKQAEYDWEDYRDYRQAEYQDTDTTSGVAPLKEESAMDGAEWEVQQANLEEANQIRDVAAVEETLNADTEYVLQERDLLRDTVVETAWQIPGKYMGMNRELFLASMEEYAENPPLSEKERGFVGLEVLSFSPERVVVQMNYEYVQPSESFYLVVQDNEIVVLLEDMETVFINTGIRLEELPESVQMKIIQMYFIESEESLYNFLETYSS